MTTSTTRLIPAAELRQRVEVVFTGYGLPAEDAAIVADTLVEADLRNVRSHGVMRVPMYVRLIKAGDVVAQPQITVVRDEGPTALMDGGRAMGQVSSTRAMRLAIEKARQYGTGSVGLRNSRHCGAMAYFANLALEAGCIGFATTNAGINMAPWGGKQKLVGNNPFAMAVPTSRPWPMVLDMATSVAAGGKLDMAAIKGQKIPPGWGLDKDGNPTDDPRVAREGSLLPVGGPKGYGMALMLDVLAGVLTGGRFGAGLGMPGYGQFFLALDVERFQPLEEFKARMDQLIDQIHDCPLGPGCERVYVPGEIEYLSSQERLEKGIPIESSILDEMDKLTREIPAAG